MSKQAFKRVRRSLSLPVNRDPLPAFAWPGGYPLFYVFRDGGCICPTCVNEEIEQVDEANRGGSNRNSHGGWAVDAVEPNWEDDTLHCDHCQALIPSAYGEPEPGDG